jgi:mono/diheme cytochrome c family protein
VSFSPLSRSARGGLALSLVCATAAVFGGCRGGVSEDPPLHLVPDMDNQAHKRAQSMSPVFADGRAARRPVEHTVARGHLRTDTARFEGKDESGQLIPRIPFDVTEATLSRGEERYNIFCAPCHDKMGSGLGAVPRRLEGTADQSAFSGIPSLTLGRLADAYDGELFQTITHGKGRMPGYAAQVPADDRWAIIAWVRVLQDLGGRKPKPGTQAPEATAAAPAGGASATAAPTATPATKTPASPGGGSQ